MGLYLLEYMVPFSRNIKGIEHASQAFYESHSGIEDSLLQVYSGSVGQAHGDSLLASLPQDFGYSVSSSGMLIPAPGEGDSEYDDDWNQVSQEQAISLFV
jgi:hypothetical protein